MAHENCTQRKTEAILKLLTKHGVSRNSASNDRSLQKVPQKKNKNIYHNTLSLLRQYRTIAWLLECFPQAIAEELEKPFETVDELIDQVDVEMSFGNRKLENRMESMKKTRLVLDRVNEALTVLKRKPDDGERLYELIYLTYIAPEVLNHNDLLYRLNLSSRQYYRLREQAVSIISIRLWSAPNQEVDFWLDLLAVLEEE